jgi:hypothetical protein
VWEYAQIFYTGNRHRDQTQRSKKEKQAEAKFTQLRRFC